MNLIDILQMSKEDSRAYLERLRWPDGAVCPHCAGKNICVLRGKSTRPGLYKCRPCQKQFTVTVGTIFEDSHVPLNKWLGAFYLLCSSKKGYSSNQLHRDLGVAYKTAWYMTHRIRLAMRSKSFDKLKGVVEADETYIGKKTNWKLAKRSKTPVVALVQRTGKVKTAIMPQVTARNMEYYLSKNVDEGAMLMTDQASWYRRPGKKFIIHKRVNHSKKEYVRGISHINTAESFFSLMKRGLYGTFHHVSVRHLRRYAEEFEFRWNNRLIKDHEVMDVALRGSEGRRLTFREHSLGKLQ